MKIDAISMKARVLQTVRERLRELVSLVEDAFPDLAEEIAWLEETVYQEGETLADGKWLPVGTGEEG